VCCNKKENKRAEKRKLDNRKMNPRPPFEAQNLGH
jgi:hypothetical protein